MGWSLPVSEPRAAFHLAASANVPNLLLQMAVRTEVLLCKTNICDTPQTGLARHMDPRPPVLRLQVVVVMAMAIERTSNAAEGLKLGHSLLA